MPDDQIATEDDDTLLDDAVIADPIAADLLTAEIAELDSFIADIEALGGQDTKADQLYNDLGEAIAAATTASSYSLSTPTRWTTCATGSPGPTSGSPVIRAAEASSWDPDHG